MSVVPAFKMKPADMVVGGVLVTLALAAFGVIGYVALPYLIAAAANTILFLGEVAVLIFMAIVGFDRGFWTGLFYGWKNVSRKIRRTIAREDPLGVIATVITRFTERLQTIDDNITKAVGAYKRHMKAVRQAQDKATEEESLVRQAQKSGNELQVKQHALASARWMKMVAELEPMGNTLVEIKSMLERARDLCSARIADLESQRDVLSVQLETSQSSSAVVKSIRSFFGSNPDLEMHGFAVEEIERQSNEAEAELDEFMRVMDPVITGQDLKASAEALRVMEKFTKFLDAPAVPVVALPEVKEAVLVK